RFLSLSNPGHQLNLWPGAIISPDRLGRRSCAYRHSNASSPNDIVPIPRRVVTTGASRCSQHGSLRDEDTIETAAEGARSLLTTAHRTAGEGRPIPQTGTARTMQSGMG